LSAPILSARDVIAGYVRGLPIVHGVSVEVAPGEIVTIVGPNGAGKSTLLKAIAGLIVFESGSVTMDGRDVTGLPAHTMVGMGVGFVPQTGNIFTSLSIQENLVVGAHSLTRTQLRERLERTYEHFPVLAARKSAQGRVLSGGQRQVLAVARALMADPKVIMLDEPTAGLSPKIVGDVFDDLRRLAGLDVGVLMVEQNARAAIRISDRAYVLTEGRNYIDGTPDVLLNDPAIGEAFLGGRRRAG
jgi:branched-chain amino acid transport system ATP-binding protein